ncbi:MAG: EAL domain-containing protein [Novosphingobium sp.]
MSSTAANSTTLPKRLPALAVLGLAEPADGDWWRLRGMQYAQIGRMTMARLIAHALAALLVVQLFVHTAPLMLIGAWLAALVFALAYSAQIDRRVEDAERRRFTPSEVHDQTVGTLAAAIVWALPVVIFTQYGSAGDRMSLWTVTAMLVTGMLVGYAAVPRCTLIFAGVIGGASALGFLYQGQWVSAAVVMVFGVFVSVGAVEVARTFLGGKVAEAGMAERNEVVSLLLREFEENEADWLWQVDASRRVRGVSPRFAFALGRETEDVDGQPLIQLISGPAWDDGRFHPSLHQLAEKLKRRESFADLLVQVTLPGGERWWELSASPRFDDAGHFTGFRGVGSDVTEKRENADKIAYLARYDTLTGLPNRLQVNESLGEALAYSVQWRGRCAFMMIDLDRFKAINDTLGHLVGDQLLAQVSARLRAMMPKGTMCGRLGGDEFAVVVADASDGAAVRALADRVIESLSRPYDVDHHTLYVGASIGSALGPRDGPTVETLMRNADLALYRAKDEGRGRHCIYEPELHAQAEERRKLEIALRRALDRQEFALAFQPVVDAIDESVVSFEALLRWNSKEHGSVSPAKFIPLAEDTRQIVQIGEWVLREACREATNWPARVKIAVNVSGEQLLDPHFAETVVSALSASGLPPHRLEIEVTESIFVRDGTTAQATLERIMALGCGVALDDFGTGYSSLGYLRRMRFSTIKVDRSFVQGAARNNPESLAIIRAVVAMADSLEMSTTAEGVETEDELAMVRRLGCRKIQGYYFGRPMPSADARGLFRSEQPRLIA